MLIDGNAQVFTMTAVPFATLSILVVDDDPAMLELTSECLASLRVKRVITAQDGREGLQWLRGMAAEIDVIICDLDMPEMDGLEFLRHAIESGWDRAVIFVSGTDAKLLRIVEVIGRARSVHALETVAKPATATNLAAALRHVTARSRPNVRARPSQAISHDDLTVAIEHHQFVLEYQPKIDLSTGAMVGCEALVRWDHPVHGRIGPGAFIPIAEQHDLIHAISTFVMERAVADAAAWRRKGHVFGVSVNISSRDLDDLEWPGYLEALARRHAVPANTVTLELTESAAMVNIGHSLEVLARCRLKGFALSIDDFGTGFSSLAKLAYVPFTELKIDRQFVQEADRNPAALKILEMSANLALDLGIDSVAEGVETQAQLDLVRVCRCTATQGFYFAKPMPVSALLAWTESWPSNSTEFIGRVSSGGPPQPMRPHEGPIVQ